MGYHDYHEKLKNLSSSWLMAIYHKSTTLDKLHKHDDVFRVYGALHTGPWIRIWCESGIQIKRPLCLHMVSIRICIVCCTVLKDCVWDPVLQSTCHVELTQDHIQSGSGIWIQIIRFQCPYGEPLCHMGELWFSDITRGITPNISDPYTALNFAKYYQFQKTTVDAIAMSQFFHQCATYKTAKKNCLFKIFFSTKTPT